MMKVQIDNKAVRASTICPLCHKAKLTGLIVCWPCYRSYGLQYGNPEAEKIIESFDADKIQKEGGDNSVVD